MRLRLRGTSRSRLRQHPAQIVVLLLDGLHRRIDGGSDVRPFRQLQEIGEARLGAQIQHAARLIVGLADRAASLWRRSMLRLYGMQRLFDLFKFVIGIAQKDQPQHRHGILRRFQLGIGAQIVGGIPQAFFDVGRVGGHEVS
jgi:hypothetical protein